MRWSTSYTILLAAMMASGCNRGAVSPQAVPSPSETRKDGLAPPVLLEVGGKPVVSGYPFLGDIDGDGLNDLLMGGDPNGRLLVYRNVGTAAAPRMSEPQWFDEWVQKGRVPRGCSAGYFYPQLMDFDGDGRPDLLSGSHCCDSFGFHVFRRADNSWSPRTHHTVASESKYTGVFVHRSFVTAADWNGDRIPDLLWRSGGNLGIGVALGPLTGHEPLELEHEVEFTPRPTTVDEGVHDFSVADWDRDGKPDLLVRLWLDGGKGGIYWYRNLGGPGLKQLAPGKLLLGEDVLVGPMRSTRSTYGFCVGDWDGDGWSDLIVTRQDLIPPGPEGSWQGSVWLYSRE